MSAQGSSGTRVLGLIGGIASGKSTVAKVLSEKCGAAMIDADKLGHESYAQGQPCYEKLVQTFGPEIVAQDGSIDRKALGGLVFGNPETRKQLESIVWPAIRTLAEQRLQSYKEQQKSCVILEAAVMLEAGWRDLVDELWVVSIPAATAQTRLMRRNSLSTEQAAARINSQAANEVREAAADVVIRNEGTVEELQAQVEQLYAERFKHNQ